MAQNLKFYSCEQGTPKTKRFEFVREWGELKLFKFASDPTESSYAWIQQSEGAVLLPGHFTFSLLERKPEAVPDTLEGWKTAIRESLLRGAENGAKLPYYAAEFGFTDAEVAKSESDYYAAKAERDAKRKADREQREADEAAKEVARIAELKESVREDKSISGDELVDLARELGISVHPRTVGLLRKRVRSIKSGQASITGKSLPSNTPYNLYKECRSILTEETAAV